MARRTFDLKSLLDIPLWETVQDHIARLTGTAIITVDFKGIPITKHSCRTRFCSVIRENPVSRKRCFRCDALAGLEAVRLGKPYIYLCHCGIVDVAIPVMVGETYLGAVMFGQIRIANDDTDAKVEHLVNEISSFQTETDAARRDLMEMYNMLPEVEYKRIVEIAELIDSIVKYIVNRAVKSQTDARTYEWLLESVSGARGGASGAHLDDVLPSAEPLALPEGITESSAVYPALAYIADHPSEAVAMKDMARLCHLSPGYFSRVFNRDTGETFVSYVNRRKTELAKVMLRETDKSVTQIAGELGYINISHFISLFKRFEGITPKVYRQYKYK